MSGQWARQWRGGLAALRDPVARYERRLRRARRSLTVRSLATLALAWVTSAVGSTPGVEMSEVFFGAVAGATALGALGAGRRVWRMERGPRPVRPVAPPPPPPPGSVARPPLDRLASRERALGDLLALLGPAAGDIAVDAAAAASVLREHAARVVAVEAARTSAPAEAGAGLDAALAALRQRLEEGVSAYDRLVTAAADAVSASAGGTADGVTSGLRRLEDASDTLLGLARGLREVAGTDHTAPA